MFLANLSFLAFDLWRKVKFFEKSLPFWRKASVKISGENRTKGASSNDRNTHARNTTHASTVTVTLYSIMSCAYALLLSLFIIEHMLMIRYKVSRVQNDASRWLQPGILGPGAAPPVKILHLSVHGSATLGVQTLRADGGSKALTRGDFVESLARCGADFELAVLDMCSSRGYAEALMCAEPRPAQFVVYWYRR